MYQIECLNHPFTLVEGSIEIVVENYTIILEYI